MRARSKRPSKSTSAESLPWDGDIATVIVSMSSLGVRPVSRKKRAVSSSAEMWSRLARTRSPSGVFFSSFQWRTATVAASAGTSAIGSSVRRTARASAQTSASAAASARRETKVNGERRMSEVLSGKQPRGEAQGRGGEDRRGTEDGEVVEVGDPLRRLGPGDERDGRLAELGGLRQDPVEAVDDPGGRFGGDRGGDLVVCHQDRGEEEDRVGRHERHARRGRDDSDQEGERDR